MRFRPLLPSALILLAAWSCKSSDGTSEAKSGPAEPGGSAPESIDSEAMGATGPSEPGEASAFAIPAGAPEGAAGNAGGQDPANQDFLDQESERIKRLNQRREFLSGQYLQQGDALVERGDLEGALVEYANALEVDPSNQEARDAMRRVQGWLGDRYAQVPDFMEDELEREVVRRQQARIAAEEFTLQGDQALREGDYDEAIGKYRQAELILRYHPLVATASLDEQILRNKLESALGLRESARLEDRQQAEREAEELRLRKEEEAREYRANQLRALYKDSWAAYQRENYKQAENLANQILLLDPGNEDAIAMRDVARTARHQHVDETIRRDMREQWIRTFEELDLLGVPQVSPLIFDDLERWSEVSQRRPYEFDRLADPVSQMDTELILDKLDQSRVAPKFGIDGEGAPLDEIATFLQQVTGVNFIISNRVREDLDEDETSVYLDLPDRSVRKVLELISEVSESLRWKIEDGVVKFVTVDEMIGGQVLRMFDVQDLIHPVRDFPGRELNVEPSGGLEPFDEDFPEREALVVTSDSLEGLIRDNVEPESWDADPNNALRITEQGVLVVNQTPDVLEKIQKLLDDLREATGIMVDIEARFLNVQDNFLEDIGVDFRGLGSPGPGTSEFFNDFGDPSAQQDLGQEIGQDTSLGAFFDEGDNGDIKARIENLYDLDLGDEDVLTPSGGLSFQWVYLNDLQLEMILRAVSKSERVEIVTAPRLLVFNTARANLTVLNQLAYVQDFDVEIAQGASIADPIVNVVEDGVILDVRPVVSADRRFITLEMRPTVAVLRRPIAEVTTTLGAASSVTIQLPELEISRVRTSVPMPDGSTVMLGGMKLSERQDLRSGIPILNQIPVLSFLFERKGSFVSKRKLLILLKARIVIPQELEPSPAQLGQFTPR